MPIMSTRTIGQAVLRAAKDGSRAPVLASSWRKSSFSLTPGTGSALNSRNGCSFVQTRLFQSTPVRRVLESTVLDSTDVIFNLCFGAAAGLLVDRLLPKNLWFSEHKPDNKQPSPSAGSPLHSWMLIVDRKTSHDVRDIVSAGFEMAHKTPKRRRQQALREATFQTPHEVARVIPGAGPDSRLEDMGPLPSIMEEWTTIRNPELLPVFKFTREGRVFLYFPDGESKATAAFVAINAEIFPPEWTIVERFAVTEFTEDQEFFVTGAACAWVKRYMTWEDDDPQIINRIEKGKLPVIFNFRELASSALYDTETNGFPDRHAVGRLANLTKP